MVPRRTAVDFVGVGGPGAGHGFRSRWFLAGTGLKVDARAEHAAFKLAPCQLGGSPDSTQSGRSPDLLDNLVGVHQHRLRHSEAKRLGGPEVDDQLEGRRLLDRQIGGLGAVENLSRVGA